MDRARLAVVLSACAAAGTACVFAVASFAGTEEQVPLWSDGPSYYVERDMPKTVQDRGIQRQRQAFAMLRGTGIAKPSEAAGCRPTDFPGSLGPPAPKVTARIIGYHVEVVVRLATVPNSLACRPWGVSIAIHGKSINPAVSSIPWVQTFERQGSAGRMVTRLPEYTTPPYEMSIYAVTIQNRRSKRVVLNLSCPTNGCVPFALPKLHRTPPHKKFPLIGVNRKQLEESFLEGMNAVRRTAPYIHYTAHCESTAICTVSYTDPLFPKKPYHLRFLIAGEQTSGCWAVVKAEPTDNPPYEDVPRFVPDAGCVSWPT